MTQLRAFSAVIVQYDEWRATVCLPRGQVADDLLGMVALGTYLGHSDPGRTRRTYAHPFPAERRAH